ncbi:hypothetical protein NLJ89_g12308 [Agrocybe chaxingu]|uniref:Uncharacterized protein n=1 Tax=Agrocybe chaxingu TaxID=84603 RepID=A0A9W8JK87_9AGAR|nr:hypothetical protein NLJ89_g12308 [Agrocybe chaxingu]
MGALAEARCELPHQVEVEEGVQLIRASSAASAPSRSTTKTSTSGLPSRPTSTPSTLAQVATELERLRGELCQSEVGSGSRRGQRERTSTGAVKRARVVLGALEGMQVEDKNATDVYTQTLHLTLQNLAHTPFTSPSAQALSKRAAAILKHWDAIFGGQLVTRRWVFRGVHYLDYLPRDHEVVASRHDEAWRDASVRWPAQIAFKN